LIFLELRLLQQGDGRFYFKHLGTKFIPGIILGCLDAIADTVLNPLGLFHHLRFGRFQLRINDPIELLRLIFDFSLQSESSI
jgi:hypothetical protein